MQVEIAKARMKARPPDILLRPAVDGFGALDFFKAGRILEAAAPAKAKLKEELATMLGSRSP